NVILKIPGRRGVAPLRISLAVASGRPDPVRSTALRVDKNRDTKWMTPSVSCRKFLDVFRLEERNKIAGSLPVGMIGLVRLDCRRDRTDVRHRQLLFAAIHRRQKIRDRNRRAGTEYQQREPEPPTSHISVTSGQLRKFFVEVVQSRFERSS